MMPVTAPMRPPVVIWFLVYGWALVLMYLGLATMSLVFFLRPSFELDMARGEAVVVGSVFLALGLIFAAACLPPLVAGRQSWAWTYGLVLICIGMTGCTLPVCIPLLIFWLKPEVKAYYGKE